MLGTSSCAASFLSLCDSFGLGFATREISPFVCGSTPHTPEDGRPMPLCGSRVLYVITSLSPFGPESTSSVTTASPLHSKDPQPDFVDTTPTSVYVPAGKVQFVPLGPESHTSATPTSPLHAKDLQPDFVDAIPISVYVSAVKAPIGALESSCSRNRLASSSPSMVHVMLRRRP